MIRACWARSVVLFLSDFAMIIPSGQDKVLLKDLEINGASASKVDIKRFSIFLETAKRCSVLYIASLRLFSRRAGH